MTEKESHAENVVIKEDWYDLNKYSDEIRDYITDKKNCLGHHADMWRVYNILYRNIFSGAEQTDKRLHYPFLKQMYNTYMSALIEACLPGYSALFTSDARNPASVLLNPKLKDTMINQFKSIGLIENLTANSLPDWITKGETILYMKLKQTTERYREKESVSDLETGKEVLSFKVDTYATYEDVTIDVIDPLDFYVDAMDYEKDPKAAVKIIRTFISARDLLTDKTNYPKLTEEQKRAIIGKIASDPYNNQRTSYNSEDYSQSRTSANQVEVLTYLGDYVTKDGKLLTNIKAITVEDQLAYLEYNPVDTLQVIYAPYVIDRQTHRGVSPLASVIPIDRLANKCVDLFIANMDEVSNPIIMYQYGSIPNNGNKKFRQTREIEYNDGISTKPEFFSPPEISPNGMNLMNVILEQQKEVLGLNRYMSGDTSGAVRTAQESQILFQKANARMRVETDVFSYKVLLPLITNFYAFNRELALAVGHPLEDIYSNPELMVTISTGASKADSEGEVNKLMQILSLPAISQPIFQWAAESDNMPVAIRYLFAKMGLTDVDNILGLMEHPEKVPPVGETTEGSDVPDELISPDGTIQSTDQPMVDDNQLQSFMDILNEGGDQV